jgi:O-antigen/teichoic acid export membrane protein
MLVIYGIGLVSLWLWLRTSTPWLKLGFAHARKDRLRALLSPSLSYMLVPLGLATVIHMPVILLGAVAGPAAVALYSVSRTVTRLGTSVSNVLNNSFVPEYSFAWGRRDIAGFGARMRFHAIATVILTALYAGVGLWLAPIGVRILSGGQIIAQVPLIVALLAAVLAEMLWTAAFAPLSAINRHGQVARAFFGLAMVALVGMAVLAEPVTMAICVAIAGGLTLIVALFRLRVEYSQMREETV